MTRQYYSLTYNFSSNSVKEGVFRQYKGPRDSNSFVSFVEEKKWEKTEAISKWKDPNSLQMSLVSYFFKISMALRAVHNRLVEEYGIPYWGSYVIFAFATILLGALLGLLIVFMIDMFFPASPLPQERKSPDPGLRSESTELHSKTEKDGLRKRRDGDATENDDQEDQAKEDPETKKSS